ncbi:MAG TPA: type II toxin-antitoxin system VapC family toxin [Longimicrobium sp.]|nr:type II toxin-antitoxin system VapC family toxin [Longimicrobium sp.]
MIHVLDACAMLAYLRGEEGGRVVDELLASPGSRCVAHSVNLCEVYYDLARQAGTIVAEEAIYNLQSAGVAECGDLDGSFWRSVGRFKAVGKVSLADCFCLALAQRMNGEVVTSDRHEFEAWVPRGVCPIRFIR